MSLFPMKQKYPRIYNCSVKGCANNSRDDKNLTFHTFPNPQVKQTGSCVYISDYFGNETKVDQLTAWLHVLKIQKHQKGMRVCSAHFKKEDYSFPDVQYSTKRQLLVKNAVPSLNLPVANEAKDKLNRERLKRRLMREISNSLPTSGQSAPADHNYSSLVMNENNILIQGDLAEQEAFMTVHPRSHCSGINFGESAHEAECSNTSSGTVPCVNLNGSEGCSGEPGSLQLFLKDVFQDEDVFAAHDGSEESSDEPILFRDSGSISENANGQDHVSMDDSGVFAEHSFTYANHSTPSVSQQNLGLNSQILMDISCNITDNPPRTPVSANSSAAFIDFDGPRAEQTPEETTEQTIRQQHIGLQVDYKYSILDMLNTDQQLSSATGLENFKLLDVIVKCMKIATKHRYERRNVVMDTRKRVIMTYVKLKHNISYRFLSLIFGSIVTEQHCGKIFVQTILMLNKVMKAIALPWPSRQTIRRNMPKCFKGLEKTRIVLDCTEIFIQRPQNLCCRIQVYSNYKGAETAKLMTGITPGGTMAYISKPYGGRHSDSAIFPQSDLVTKLEPGDGVMVDKGFLIDEICEKNKLCLIRPPFLRKKNNRKFTAEEAIVNKGIAAARVHVERFNQRIKVFDMLGGVYPISLLPIIGEVFNVVCGTVNLSSPILDDKNFMKSQ